MADLPMETELSHNGINCLIYTSKNLVRGPCGNVSNRRQACNLMYAFFGVGKEMMCGEDNFGIPCLGCSNYANYSDYLRHYEYRFAESIYSSSFPYLSHSRDSAVSFASDIVNRFLHRANATHRCSNLYFTTRHDIHIVIPPVAVPPFETALVDGSAAKPASFSFISDLFRARGEKPREDVDRYERDWRPADHECSICKDEIDKSWVSLTLPCSHIFHETCILKWFEKNNVCPICRFQMPIRRSQMPTEN